MPERGIITTSIVSPLSRRLRITQQYLAPYIFRVAISNNRILKLEAGRVTFSYKESATDQTKLCTLAAEEFLHRFLQHVLPNRFV